MNDDSKQQRPAKKARLFGDEDSTDVVLVVGGKEFQEHSRHLCHYSKYFEAAFRSGMKEAQEGKFTFPDDKPSEWEQIRFFLKPFADVTKINHDNIETVLLWFDKLEVREGMKYCEDYLRKEIMDARFTYPTDPSLLFQLVMFSLPLSLRFHLMNLRKVCAETIRIAIRHKDKRILRFDHMECLWSIVEGGMDKENPICDEHKIEGPGENILIFGESVFWLQNK